MIAQELQRLIVQIWLRPNILKAISNPSALSTRSRQGTEKSVVPLDVGDGESSK